jgi:hypothetical protein
MGRMPDPVEIKRKPPRAKAVFQRETKSVSVFF